ncbi:MAG: hypothetical protein V4467_03605 [Patescibacteria group bacterium]
MEILSKLFGGDARVKILRLFLFNPGQTYSSGDIAMRSKVALPAVRHEVALMKKLDMIKGKRFSHFVPVKRKKKMVMVRKTEGGWILNSTFPYLSPMRELLINTVLVRYGDIIRRLNSAGRIKLVIISGIFIRDEDSRVDIFVVGDGIRMVALENIIKTIESEIGKELRYAAFETADFKYRVSMHDKLIRDVLDFPHKIILDRLNFNANL